MSEDLSEFDIAKIQQERLDRKERVAAASQNRSRSDPFQVNHFPSANLPEIKKSTDEITASVSPYHPVTPQLEKHLEVENKPSRVSNFLRSLSVAVNKR